MRARCFPALRGCAIVDMADSRTEPIESHETISEVIDTRNGFLSKVRMIILDPKKTENLKVVDIE